MKNSPELLLLALSQWLGVARIAVSAILGGAVAFTLGPGWLTVVLCLAVGGAVSWLAS